MNNYETWTNTNGTTGLRTKQAGWVSPQLCSADCFWADHSQHGSQLSHCMKGTESRGWGSSTSGVWGSKVLEKGRAWGGNGKSLHRNSFPTLHSWTMHTGGEVWGTWGMAPRRRWNFRGITGWGDTAVGVQSEGKMLLTIQRIYKINIDTARGRQNFTTVVRNFNINTIELTDRISRQKPVNYTLLNSTINNLDVM